MVELIKDAEIALVLPQFNKFSYNRRAILSALKYTNRTVMIIVIDDASTFYDRQDWSAWRKDIPESQLVFKHFGKNQGLTAGWNYGLRTARNLGIKYTVCTNSDILFTRNWDVALINQLERGYQLVAPVTNAPGPTNMGAQHVKNFCPFYKLDDSPGVLNEVAHYLRDKYQDTVKPSVVNGFFMMAKTEQWWKGCFAEPEFVFNPKNKMVRNEDELQGRWLRKRWKIGFVPSSFIFHYRAVSRGDNFKHRGWFRLEDIGKPV